MGRKITGIEPLPGENKVIGKRLKIDIYLLKYNINNDVFIHAKVIKLDTIVQSRLKLTSFFTADLGHVKRLSHSPV